MVPITSLGSSFATFRDSNHDLLNVLRRLRQQEQNNDHSVYLGPGIIRGWSLFARCTTPACKCRTKFSLVIDGIIENSHTEHSEYPIVSGSNTASVSVFPASSDPP